MQPQLSRSHSPSAAHGFAGTIASACDSGIGIDDFIAMARFARTSDPGVTRFLDAWDALSATEQQSARTADEVCEQVGVAPLELLKAVADAAYRFSVYTARIIAAMALPSVVQSSVDVALTAKGVADRKMLFQHSGFLPTPRGSQTTIAITQNTQAAATVLPPPSPEETIRRLQDRFNEARKNER